MVQLLALFARNPPSVLVSARESAKQKTLHFRWAMLPESKAALVKLKVSIYEYRSTKSIHV